MTRWPQDDINLLGGTNQPQPRQPYQEMQAMSPELRHSSSNTSSEGGLQRESFGRARSHPLKVKGRRSSFQGEKRKSLPKSSLVNPSTLRELQNEQQSHTGQSLKFRTSDREIQLTYKRSKSATNLDSTISGVGKDGNRNWTRKLSLGASKEEDEEVYVTRHMLYKVNLHL
jgi:hypothetical protein